MNEWIDATTKPPAGTSVLGWDGTTVRIVAWDELIETDDKGRYSEWAWVEVYDPYWIGCKQQWSFKVANWDDDYEIHEWQYLPSPPTQKPEKMQ